MEFKPLSPSLVPCAISLRVVKGWTEDFVSDVGAQWCRELIKCCNNNISAKCAVPCCELWIVTSGVWRNIGSKCDLGLLRPFLPSYLTKLPGKDPRSAVGRPLHLDSLECKLIPVPWVIFALRGRLDSVNNHHCIIRLFPWEYCPLP